MSSGFDVDFDMSSDEISVLMKKYKKIKKYQSLICLPLRLLTAQKIMFLK